MDYFVKNPIRMIEFDYACSRHTESHLSIRTNVYVHKISIYLPPIKNVHVPSKFEGDTTGRDTIYTVYEGHEVMFHISTMLPYSADNKQQVCISLYIYKYPDTQCQAIWLCE